MPRKYIQDDEDDRFGENEEEDDTDGFSEMKEVDGRWEDPDDRNSNRDDDWEEITDDDDSDEEDYDPDLDLDDDDDEEKDDDDEWE